MAARVEFDWDPAKAAVNLAKHKVALEEAMTVFGDPFALSRPDEDHGTPEERWVTIGLSRKQNMLLVVHTHVDIGPDHTYIRIISHASRPARETAV